MNNRLKIATLAFASMLPLASNPIYGQSVQEGVAQVSPHNPKAYLMTVLRGRGCLPADVIAVGQGGAPPEGIEVLIQNFDWKIIRAVKIGWYIVEDEDRTLPRRVLNIPCDAPRFPEKIILSGATPLIEIGPLYPQQTCAIGKDPLKLRYDADKTVLTNYHLITINDLKELTTDGTFRTFKKPYDIFLAVSEIGYQDGSTWKLEGAPPPLAPAPK